MVDTRQISDSSKIIKELIKKGLIVKPAVGFDVFFMNKSLESIAVAKRILELDEEEGLNTRLWVINSSYYSMFFAATALLAKSGHKIRSEIGIHKMTYHALVHYFMFENNKLELEFASEYKDAIFEAETLLQISERKIDGMVNDFEVELAKRKTFTYEMGKSAEINKAKVSYERARRFVLEVEKIMKG